MIAVRLPESMEKRIGSYAERLGKTKTEIVKEALELYFSRRSEDETPYGAGKELFGRHGSGDGDRSETYKTKLKAKLRAKTAR